MALNYITLVLDLADGTGTPLATSQALLNPSAQLSPGEKLTTDYALFDDYDGMMHCRCGTLSCRDTIGGRDWQRPDVQRKYGSYFSSHLPAPASPPAGPPRLSQASPAQG